MAKRKRIPFQSAFQKANERMQEETAVQCFRLYSAAAIALYRYWNKRRLTLTRLFEIVHTTWMECATDNKVSMIQICEQETGIEIQNGDGTHWRELAFLNHAYEIDPAKMTNAQWVVMRNNQIRWVRPQIMACLLVALHRKYHFGYERCARVYAQIEEVEREFNCKPYRLHEACLSETGIDIREIINKKGEVSA